MAQEVSPELRSEIIDEQVGKLADVLGGSNAMDADADADRLAILDRDAILARVASEFARFRAAIPRLLAPYGGTWVVFRDGAVASAHPDEESAYVEGLRRFGPGGGHVVAVVREPEQVLLSARVAFGL